MFKGLLYRKGSHTSALSFSIIVLICILAFSCIGMTMSFASQANKDANFARAAESIVYWDPIEGSDSNDGLTVLTPKKEFDNTDGVMSVIGAGDTYRTVKMIGNALAVTADTIIDGATENGNVVIERDGSYSGNLFIVSNRKNLLLQNVILPSTSGIAVSVASNATLWLDNVSFGDSNQDVISLEGGYVTLVGNNTNSYVLSTNVTADGTVLVKSNGSLLNLNDFSLISALNSDYYLAKNTSGDICIYAVPVVPVVPEPITVYDDTVYISDAGSDENTGAVETQPVKTIEKAVEIARANESISKLGIAGDVKISSYTTWSNASTFGGEFTDGIVTAGGTIMLNSTLRLDIPMTVEKGTGIIMLFGALEIRDNGSITVNGENAIGVDNAANGKTITIGAIGRLTALNGVAYQVSGPHTINTQQTSYITASGAGKAVLIKKSATVTVNSSTAGLTFHLSNEFSMNDKVTNASSGDYAGATFINANNSNITSSVVFLSNGQYWVNDCIYLDGTNGDDANNGRLPSEPVKTMAKAVELANNAGISRINVIGTYNVTADLEIDASGITIISNSSANSAVISVDNISTLTLSEGTIDGIVNVNGTLDYRGGEVTILNVYGTVILYNATPTSNVINVLASANNPIVEADDIIGTEIFTVKFNKSMIGFSLVSEGGEHDAIYKKSNDTAPEMLLIGTQSDDGYTGTITVSGRYIYVKSTGDDSLDGLTEANAVATVVKALELLSSHENFAIMLLDTATVLNTQTWSKGSLSWSPIIYRGFSNDMLINVQGESASLTLENVIIDGEYIISISQSFLVSVSDSAQFIMNDGSIIRNSSTGGVSVDSSSFILNGGMICDNGKQDENYGRGVKIYRSTFRMYGGSFSFNKYRLRFRKCLEELF